MKCLVKDGVIIRVTDDEAEVLKKEGYVFCPKTAYKKQQKPGTKDG